MRELFKKPEITVAALLVMAGMILSGCGSTPAPINQEPSPAAVSSQATEVPLATETLTATSRENLNFAHELEIITGSFTGDLSNPDFSTITREEIFGRLGNVSNYPTWMRNEKIAEFTNQKGQKITFSTDENGEVKLKIDAQNPERVEYPRYDGKNVILEFDEKQDGKDVRNYLVVYGTDDVLSRFESDDAKLKAKNFLKEYFVSTFPTLRVLHLVMVKNDSIINFADIGNTGVSLQPNMVDNLAQAIYVTGVDKNTRQKQVGRADVFLSLEKTHNSSLEYGIPLTDTLTQVFVNEITDLEIKRVTANYDGSKGKQPEAPGTIISFAAAYDPELASKILGGKSYLPFVDFLVTEMQANSTPAK